MRLAEGVNTYGYMFAALGLLVLPAGPVVLEGQETPLLLTHAWLIDGTGADVADDAWIHIEGDSIVAVGRGAPPSVAGAQVMNVSGRTVLPGLADMHVHLGELAQARWMLKLLLAYGVTRVKDSGNSLGNLAAIREWVAAEEAVPSVYMSGVTLNGSRPDLDFLGGGSQVQALLEDNAAFGVDFIKIHNWISSQALTQIVAFAREHDLLVTGHVPLGMTSVAALDAGMNILEHVRMRPHEVLDDPEVIARFPLDVAVMIRTGFWAYVDPESPAVQRTLDAWVEREFFIDPTLVVHWNLAYSNGPEITEAPELERVSRATLARWRRSATRYGDLSPEEFIQAQHAAQGAQAFVGQAHQRGIKILTGTDTPVNWVIPGRSLHRELELLVGAGLSPVEAIHSSTGRAAEALRTADRGTIVAGAAADLVIVGGYVAGDITALRRVERVMLGGRIYERGALLEEAERLAAVHN